MGFTREEWSNLSWMDKRMYRETLADYLYEQHKSEWESKPAGKRGEPPKPPRHAKFTDDLKDQAPTKEEIPPDISDIIPVEWMDETE